MRGFVLMRMAALVALGLLNVTRAEGQVSVVAQPPARGVSPHYVSNRAPLLASPLVKLPIGAVRPEGWLRKQLELQADGFHGHLTEISRFLKKENNSWLNADGQGEYGWEEVPYWLKGFGDCAYLLGREDQIKETREWVEAVLGSQRDDGFFGPRGQGAKATVESTQGKYDLWPNMAMMNVLQSYHESTGDERVLEFLKKYFRWELRLADEDFLPPYWQQQRGADNLASVYWLYNRTGEPWLLDLAAKVHRNTANWTDGVPNWHNVNMMQAFGGPTTFWMQSGEGRHLEAAERNYRTIREMYGQVPGGLFGGDENCREGFTDPRQAVETCGMVEFMNSAERLFAITGDVTWADRCEDVAFNSLPAALTADFKGLRYLTAPNMGVSDRRSHSPGIQNGGPMFLFDPNDHRCCQHNFGHGWPYLAEHLWMGTLDSGLALAFPIASGLKAKVGGGEEVSITCETKYPFEETVSLKVKTVKTVCFPLYLRVPGWCQQAAVAINGERANVESKAGAFLKVEREWRDGDTVELVLPMAVTLRRWEANHDSVSVDRGPLTYSLRIDEEVRQAGGTEAWPAFEYLPASAWNYALVLDQKDSAASFAVVEREWPADDMPFTLEGTPIELAAKGRRVPEWQLDRFGLVAPLEESPVKTGEPVEPIRLVPMGAARLRISAFPVAASGGSEGHVWSGPPKPKYRASASHCFENDSVEALCDDVVPGSSEDRGITRFTFWPRQGTTEWVRYDFEQPRKVSGVEVYWFDDTAVGGGCGLPASWRVLTRQGDQWKPVAGGAATEAVRDRFQEMSFEAVETTGLRLEVKLEDGRSGGFWSGA